MKKEQGQPAELARLSLKELQQYGFTHSAEIGYRREVARRMAKSDSAKRVVFFDDVSRISPDMQTPKLAGYQTSLLPALIAASGFEEGSTVLVSAPPNPVEMHSVHQLKAKLESELGEPVQYRMLYEQNGALIDLMKLDPDAYSSFSREYAHTANQTEAIRISDSEYYFDVVSRHSATLFGDQRTLVLPFQMFPEHRKKIGALPEGNNLVFPDIANEDKALNGLYLKEKGFSHLPDFYVILGNGQVIDTYQAFIEKTGETESILSTPDNIDAFITGLIEGIDRLNRKGKKAYIKINANTYAGIGNLDASDFEEVYSQDTPDYTRLRDTMKNIIQTSGIASLPKTAIVEEFIEAGEIEGVTQDYTVSGRMVDGIFLPISIDPVQATKGVYECQWTAPEATTIGEDETQWQNLYKAYAEMGEILAGLGYKNGEFTGDIFIGADGKYYQHDYNLRRGGRSTPEVLLALIPQGWFEAQGEVELPKEEERGTNTSTYDIYTQVLNILYEAGCFPFSTGQGYFDRTNDVLKYRALIPTDLLIQPSGEPVPRDKHLPAIREMFRRLTYNIL